MIEIVQKGATGCIYSTKEDEEGGGGGVTY
jgi:hypothetical protein